MAFVRVLMGILGTAQAIVGLVALGLSAAAKKKSSDIANADGVSDSTPSLSFFIFAAVASVIVAIVLLTMACLPPSRGVAGTGLAASAISLVVWIIAVAYLGDKASAIFHHPLSDYCVVDGEESVEGLCLLLKLTLAAWVFGLLGLILSLVTLVVTGLGLRTPPAASTQKPGYPSTGGPAASQPMQRMTGQPGTAYGSTPAQNYQNNTYSASPSAQAASPSGGHGFQTGSPHQGHAGYVNGNAQAPQYPGIKASPV